MKRIGGLFDLVHPVPALARAAWCASLGKRERPCARRFWSDCQQTLAETSEALRNGTFRFDEYTSFEIRDPKTRTIRAPSFLDRIVHHAMIGATGPVFERGAIRASYACRAGRGQHAALAHARRGARTSEAFLKLDVSRFYDSVDHDLLRGRLRRRFREERLLALFDRLLESHSVTPRRGLPIGALTSQYLGNFYLDPFDHWAERRRGVRTYLRYMDDMLFFGDVACLREVRRDAAHLLALLGLAIRNGGVLNGCREGVPWLGFTIRPDGTRLDRRGRKRLRRRMRRVESDAMRGLCGERELQVRASSMFAHACCASDVRWRRGLVRSLPLGGEALEPPEPRDPRRLVERSGPELPVGVSQQDPFVEPQPQSGLSGLSAPWHGGTAVPPDGAPSRAPLASPGGDEASRRAPAETEIRRR